MADDGDDKEQGQERCWQEQLQWMADGSDDEDGDNGVRCAPFIFFSFFPTFILNLTTNMTQLYQVTAAAVAAATDGG
jgi:hypothetical protein